MCVEVVVAESMGCLCIIVSTGNLRVEVKIDIVKRAKFPRYNTYDGKADPGPHMTSLVVVV
jgi:hypothetical protein